MVMEFVEPAVEIAGAWYDQRKTDQRQNEAQEFNRVQAGLNRDFQAEQASIDRQMQRDFAENGIRMRVNDAVAAGLHPLVGAGVQPAMSQPVGVGGSQASSPGYSPSTMGQDISRAISATRSNEEKANEILRNKLLESQIQGEDLRNIMLSNDIHQKMVDSQKPGIPLPDQVKPTLPEQYSRSSKDPSRVASENPVWQKTEIAPGTFWDLPYSQGESPFESMEGFVPQMLTLWKNLWYNSGLKGKWDTNKSYVEQFNRRQRNVINRVHEGRGGR